MRQLATTLLAACITCLAMLAHVAPARATPFHPAVQTTLPAVGAVAPQAQDQSGRTQRRLRNVAIVGALAVAALGAGLWFRRQRARARAAGLKFSFADCVRRGLVRSASLIRGVASTAVRLSVQVNGSASSNSALALTGACIFLAIALLLVHLAWTDALRLGPMFLEVPWRYALAGAGAAATSVLLALTALMQWRRPTVQANTSASGASRIVGPLLLSAGCVVLILSFRWLDLWNTGFDERSWRNPLYNGLRLLFVPYLAAALVGAGKGVLSIIERRWGALGFGPIDRLLAAFFLGAAAWYIALFPVGLAGLLWFPLIAPVLVLAVWCSWPLLDDARKQLERRVTVAFSQTTLIRLALISVPVAVLAIMWLHVLVNRGIAITGFEYDASGHYLPYYQAVVENGNTWVNELWYHFWVSKGAGLHFVAVMLTDIQGPQLVSFMFLNAGLVALALMTYRVSGSLVLGASAAAMYLATFTHSFPYFQKHHLVTSALVGGLLWLSVHLSMRRDLPLAPGAAALALLGAAAVIVAPPFAAVICPFLAVIGLAAVARNGWRDIRTAAVVILPAFAAFGALAAILLTNYAVTGLMEVTPFRLFWNLANQARLSEVASPYLLLFADAGTTVATGQISLLSAIDPGRLGNLLHIQYLPDGLAGAAAGLFACMLVACWFDQSLRRRLANGIAPAAILLGIAAALTILVRQPGSIDRFYIFALLPATYLTLCPIATLMHRISAVRTTSEMQVTLRNAAVGLLAVCAVAFALLAGAKWMNGHFHHETRAPIMAKLRFAIGLTSLRETLLAEYQPRNPAVWPRQEISDACLAMRDALQIDASNSRPQPRIWTMTFLQEMGCHILPDVRIMMEFSNRFGARWHRIVFEDSSTAEKELAKIGVSHFYVNIGKRDEVRKRNESTSIFGCLAYSPLVDPEHLSNRFKVVWTDGEAYLLTLASLGRGRSLPAEFVERLEAKRAALQPALGDMQGICTRLKGYFAQYKEKWPIFSDPTLEPLKGWQ